MTPPARRRAKSSPALLALAFLACVTGAPRAQAPTATVHAPLPRLESDLWLVPAASDQRARGPAASRALADAVRSYQAGDHDAAQAGLRRVQAAPAIADYVEYYRGLTQLRLNQLPEAKRTIDALVSEKPAGALALSAALAQGEVAEAMGDHRAAVQIYRRLAAEAHLVSDEVLSRLGRAALAANDPKTAAAAYVRIYYEFALTDAAAAAAVRLADLEQHIVRTGHQADLGRAARLYGARRYAEARAAFQDLQDATRGDDRELAQIRVAECDYFLKRYAAARDALARHLDGASRKIEARFFHLSALRELGQHDEFVARTRALVSEFPDNSWAEEALNNLGTHYILTDDDRAAAAVFAELYQKFPVGARAERAAWKSGWWSYRNGDPADTVRVFDSAAAAFPRSDYRPSFLYWAGRAHAKLGAGPQAASRFSLVHHDYGNSYYGRLAEAQVSRTGPAAGGASMDRAVVAAVQNVTRAATRPPTEDRIRLLLANGMYEDALAELRYAQRQWGTSPAIEASIAWVYHQQGELRRAITAMRRAYPQSLTSRGHQLPVEMRQVLFPLLYWDLIKKHATARGLDPYIVAALIGQESTFDPTARSIANAWGLMQVVPATGRRLARVAGIRPFTTATLTTPETNIRLGTLHFSRLVQQFGGTYYALASYNAGETRIIRWKAERPGLAEDEFIDDIPFPETQNYVKRILGTAEDYRMLYGRDGGRPRSAATLPR